MSLILDHPNTRELKELIEAQGGTISVWKLLRLDVDGQLISPYVFTKWKIGLNKSDRTRITSRNRVKHNQLTPKEVRQNKVSHGFHVYTSAARARALSDFSPVVRFEAKLEDFVAAGVKADKSFHAVFSQLTLPEATVKRILKKYGSKF